MALKGKFKVETKSPNLYLTGYKGHFITGRSHTNYYIDITSQKSCLSEAKAVAQALLPNYQLTTMIDTILCLDGSEVIGTCLADMLTRNDLASINSNNTIHIVAPEYTASNQLLFRDNVVSMIQNKQVLILCASVVTGHTVRSAMEAIRYYSGSVAGVSAIFAIFNEIDSMPVHSIFNPHDLPAYHSYKSTDCPMCKNGERVDALLNSYGCSML